MSINAILACDKDWGIGKNNDLPWPRNEYDVKWFRENTLGGVIVMGRKTWESLGSKPLPKRINIVVTSQDLMMGDQENKPSATWTGHMYDCIQYLKGTYTDQKIWIIGGADIYRQSVPYCDHVYLTKFNESYDCDTFFDPKYLDRFVMMTTTEKVPGCSFSIWSKI